MTVENVTPPNAPPAKKGGIGRWVVLAIAVFFIAVLVYGLVNAGDQRIEDGKAPDFTLTTF